jgi:L-ascorbate metabolism protein UlaG (beta-lactamase superfamily)
MRSAGTRFPKRRMGKDKAEQSEKGGRRMCILRVCLGGAIIAGIVLSLAGCNGPAESERRTPMFEEDSITTSLGELKITFIGHGTLMCALADTIIHVDPVSREADYGTMPKADIILVTHEHGDHLDPAAIAAVRADDTVLLLPEKCASAVEGATVMANGDTRTVGDVRIEAVPAYNIVHKRASGEPFHPRGEGNGYVVTFGDTCLYVAGDTENIPEMKELKDIDIAFLPMNLPYTMTPEMVADAAKAFRPKILYPYHFGETDTSELVKLLASDESIEVRIRKME